MYYWQSFLEQRNSSNFCFCKAESLWKFQIFKMNIFSYFYGSLDLEEATSLMHLKTHSPSQKIRTSKEKCPCRANSDSFSQIFIILNWAINRVIKLDGHLILVDNSRWSWNHIQLVWLDDCTWMSSFCRSWRRCDWSIAGIDVVLAIPGSVPRCIDLVRTGFLGTLESEWRLRVEAKERFPPSDVGQHRRHGFVVESPFAKGNVWLHTEIES